ncbi:MAG: type III pantothenate kinase [Acidobacteriota bacterium]|jgi:type III pantothenate kinase
MLLAIDVGNTQILMGVYEGDDLRLHWRLSTNRARTTDEFGILTRTLFNLDDLDAADVSRIVVSSVVPPLDRALEYLGREYFGVEPLFVTPELVHDMPVLYEPPGDVGSDRIVNGLAARELYGKPAIVVDFGTATTFDVIDADGAYMGGTIAPGIGISADALTRRAARLPRVDIARPETVIGRTTVGSMQAGIFFGYVDLVDGLVGRLCEELGDDPAVVATGGWALAISPECPRIDHVDAQLTLKGLRLIAERYGS